MLILVIFAPWFIVGAASSFIAALVLMSVSTRRGEREPKSRLARVGLAPLAALIGGTLGVLCGVLLSA